MDVILASASPRRRELLSRLVKGFRIQVSDVDEWEPVEGDPAEQVTENARQKAIAVAGNNPEALVIGADTTVALGRRIYSKPKSMDEARSFLEQLSGKTHNVMTGVAVVQGGKVGTFHETSSVTFRPYDPDRIAAYLSAVHVLDKAGGYAIQDCGDLIIESWHGCYDNIMGLPVERLRTFLGPILIETNHTG